MSADSQAERPLSKTKRSNFIPIVVGVLVWIALGLRDRRVFQLLRKAHPLVTNATGLRE